MSIIRKEVIGGQTLILGDCMEVMPNLGRVDAAFGADEALSCSSQYGLCE